MDSRLLAELWQHHSGKIVGMSIGLLMGVFIIFIGFFKTIFIMFCMMAGYVVGKRIDEKEDLADILEKLLPPGYYR